VKTSFLVPSLLALALVAGGCQQKFASPYQFDEYRASIAASNANRKQAIDECVKDSSTTGLSPSEKKFIAVIMGLKPETAAPVICTRFINGIASGQLTYNDLAALARR
jgi:hypothetical protein